MTKRAVEQESRLPSTHSGPRRRRTFRLLTVVVVGIGLSGMSVAACGTDRPPAEADGTMFNGDVLSGPCRTEGATRACHVETSRQDNVVNCFSGTQTCTAGVWAPCGGGTGTLSSIALDQIMTSSSGLSILSASASDASTSAGGCSSNPCNPNCWGIDVDAGQLQTAGVTSTSIQGTVKSVTDFPGGPDGPKNSMGNKNATYIAGPPDRIRCTLEPPYPATTYLHCSSDFCCANYTVGTTTATCQPWVVVGGENPVAVANCNKAPGVDFTAGLACNDTTQTPAHTHVPICNRGAANATTGSLMIGEYTGNPQYSGDSNVCSNPGGSPATSCVINLATKPIPAGKCLDLDVNAAYAGSVPGITCTGLFSNGNATMMINPPATAGYTQLAEGDLCNNYSFHPTTAQGGTCAAYGTQPPPPVATTYTYQAVCPGGTKITWNQFSYNTSVPNASDVIFNISTAPLLADGGAGTFTTPVVGAHPATPSVGDPAVCPMSGPSPCPKNLATILGATAASNPILKIDLTLTATTAVPIVNAWQVTYNCTASE